MMCKKCLVILVSIMILVTPSAFATSFSDVTETHWAYEPINEMKEKGILNGYPDGSFKPEKAITRAEFAKILVETLNLKEKNDIVFEDVDEGFWANDYINIASNYLSAYRNGNKIYYMPNSAAVREDMAVAVVMATNLQNEEYNLDTLNRFSDKEEISENLKKYIAIAVENGLMNGNADGTFNPKGNLTRAEVSKLMINALEFLDKIVVEEIKILYGDADGNGLVDWDDAGLVNSYINHVCEINFKNADVNLDGKIDYFDLTYLEGYLYGKPELPHTCGIYTTTYEIIDGFDHKEMIDCKCSGRVCNITEYHEFENNKCECGAELICGDLNFDKKINNEDVEILLDYLNGDIYKINEEVADIFDDDYIDVFDWRMLESYVSRHYIGKLPCTCCDDYKWKVLESNEKTHNVRYRCDCGKINFTSREKHIFIDGICDICDVVNENEPAKTPYEIALDKLLDLGLVNKYEDGEFKPENQVTRAQFTKILVEEEGLEDVADISRTPTGFVDVPEEHWASGYINVANANGYISGYPDGTFAPDKPVKYSEAITYVVRTLGYASVVENKGTWPTNYLTKARELGLLDNMEYDSYNDNLTRGSLVILIYNMLDAERWEVIEEPVKTPYEIALDKLVELEIIFLRADGTLGGENNGVTRAELAKLLVTEEGLEPAADVAKGPTGFTDVPENHWAAGFINVASEYGFMNGYPDGSFKPYEKVKYSEAITNVVSTLGYASVVENKGTWPTNYITKARELGLLDNIVYNSYSDEITRKNLVMLIYNMLDADRFEIIRVIPGDVDSDGEITAKDRMTLARYLEKWEGYTINEANSDVNNDDEVNEIDLKILTAYFNGNNVKLPHKCENLKEEYSNVNEKTHQYDKVCNICEIIAEAKVVAHKFEDGKCKCGYEEQIEEAVVEMTVRIDGKEIKNGESIKVKGGEKITATATRENDTIKLIGYCFDKGEITDIYSDKITITLPKEANGTKTTLYVEAIAASDDGTPNTITKSGWHKFNFEYVCEEEKEPVVEMTVKIDGKEIKNGATIQVKGGEKITVTATRENDTIEFIGYCFNKGEITDIYADEIIITLPEETNGTKTTLYIEAVAASDDGSVNTITKSGWHKFYFEYSE